MGVVLLPVSYLCTQKQSAGLEIGLQEERQPAVAPPVGIKWRGFVRHFTLLRIDQVVPWLDGVRKASMVSGYAFRFPE